MGRDEPELLALRAVYGSLYNEFIRPEQKYTISHYLRTQWAPLLGAARLWFVVALRQRCYWNERQEWCVVDKKTLARESGLSTRTVNRIVAAEGDPEPDDERDGWATWFFGKKRRRRYDQQIGRTVNAPNRYHVLLDDPLTPRHQAGLVHYLRQRTAGGSGQETLDALEALCGLSDEARREVLESAPPGGDRPIPAAFVLDVVEACCPAPEQEQLKIAIARAALRLHQAITRPERVYLGTQYFRRQWLPQLGPVSALVVVNLRARCYWNEHTGELRDTCRASWTELAAEVGCTARQLRYLRQDKALQRFATIESEGHGAARSTFRVQVPDLLTDEDTARFEQRLVEWAQAQPGLEVDPESGQIDALPLLLQAPGAAQIPDWPLAEILAPGRPEPAGKGGQEKVLALGADPPSDPDRQDDQGEILAHGGTERDTAQVPASACSRTAQVEVLALGKAESGARQSSCKGLGPESQAEVLASGVGGLAEILAPRTAGQEAILAVGGRQFWRIEGLQAEVLAPEGGSFGTTGKLLFITLNQKGLSTAALELDPTLCQDRGQLAAAARLLLLGQLGIEEPNRSRLLSRCPPCCQIVAWGLYALTQRGLQNRAGYVYKRLLEGDPAPRDMVDLAGLPLPFWRAFVTAVRDRQEHLLPEVTHAAYRHWWAVFGPVWNEITFAVGHMSPADLEDVLDASELQHSLIERQTSSDVNRDASIEEQASSDARPGPLIEERASSDASGFPSEAVSHATGSPGSSPALGRKTQQALTEHVGDRFVAPLLAMTETEEGGHNVSALPVEIEVLLQPGETAQRIDDQWLLAVSTLSRACRLYHQLRDLALPIAVRIGVLGTEGRVHVAKAGILSVRAEPIPEAQWDEITAGLRLRMGQEAFDRWWFEVQPLGLTGGMGSDPPNLILCAPDRELCDYLSEHHTATAVWTCTSLLHHPLGVLFLAYSEKTLQPVPDPA